MDNSKGFKRPSNSNLPLSESQLRQSNGFSSSSSGGMARMRISGQGFRPSSRERNASQIDDDNNGLYNLNVIPLGSDEVAWANNIKVDLMQLQDEINQLDPDNKLRSSGGIEFGKSYQTSLKKWLGANSEGNVKVSLDKRLKTEIDIDKLTEALGCKGDAEGSLKKLFRLCQVADVVSNKLTEFEMLTLMRYDDSYNNLVKEDQSADKDQKQSQSKLKMMAASGPYVSSKYTVCQVNIERFGNLLRSARKLASRESGNFPASDETDKIRILEASQKELNEIILKRDFKIKELQEKIVDLEAKIESQVEEIRQIKANNISNSSQQGNIQQKVIGKSPDSFKEDPEYWTRLIDETKLFYETRLKEYENENGKLKEKLEDLKIKNEGIQEQFFDLQEQVQTLKTEKNLLFSNFSKKFSSPEEAVDSYENALKEEFDRMKKSLEKRVDTLLWDNERVKKEKARGLIEMKLKLDKEIETKNLLLKKLSCYIK